MKTLFYVALTIAFNCFALLSAAVITLLNPYL